MRLALPVTIFLIIVGFSFWGDPEKRLEIALNMTLVVAALYLGKTSSVLLLHHFLSLVTTVIGQVIPFVGYFTIMDIFVTLTFVLLSGTVAIHFFVDILHKTRKKYPMNKLIRVLIVAFCRIVWIPMSLMLFIVLFKITIPAILAMLYGTTVISLLYSAVVIKIGIPRTFKEVILK